MKKKKIIVLGASGSIGSQTLELLKNRKDYCLVGVSVGNNISFLKEVIIPQFKKTLKYIVVKNYADYLKIKDEFPDFLFYYGNEGLLNLIEKDDVEIVLNALVGFSGVIPSLKTLKLNKVLFLANKESLVVAGELIKKILKEKRKKLLYPIDSEHAAITKCLKNVKKRDLKEIIITCSGGPFFNYSLKEMKKVNIDQALNHPTYKMGKKISIDSSTLMNKAFEIIEAYYLFNVSYKKIKVLINRDSYVHSLILLKDGTYKLSVGKPDMKIQINDCLSFFKTKDKEFKDTEINTFNNYNFFDVDNKRFKALKFGYKAIKTRGIYGLVLNAANEVLVEEFLNGNIKYLDIVRYIDKILKTFNLHEELKEDNLLYLNEEVKEKTRNLIFKEINKGI